MTIVGTPVGIALSVWGIVLARRPGRPTEVIVRTSVTVVVTVTTADIRAEERAWREGELLVPEDQAATDDRAAGSSEVPA
jgi:hypothetical protein